MHVRMGDGDPIYEQTMETSLGIWVVLGRFNKKHVGHNYYCLGRECITNITTDFLSAMYIFSSNLSLKNKKQGNVLLQNEAE